ncbi:MAG: hypothetical protein ACJ8AW_10470 [Rhodopila sp.]
MNENSCGRLEPAEIQELRARFVHSAEAVFKSEKPANDPARLDRAADALLFSGSTRLAEHLANRAAEIREAAQ